MPHTATFDPTKLLSALNALRRASAAGDATQFGDPHPEVIRAKIATLLGLPAQRQLCVDGHEFANEESDWMGDGQFPPFAVFDIDAQENLLPYYATREDAEIGMARILGAGGSANAHVPG